MTNYFFRACSARDFKPLLLIHCLEQLEHFEQFLVTFFLTIGNIKLNIINAIIKQIVIISIILFVPSSSLR